MAVLQRPSGSEVGVDRDDYVRDAWIAVGYLALSLLFFLPALMPGRTLFGTDYLSIAIFFEEFATQRFLEGDLPKWLPYVYGGAPFFANPMDVYYPVSVLLRLARVATHVHLPILFVVQYFLAGWGTYALLRELGARRMPAHVAGVLYMFSGYLLSYIYGGHDGRAIVATLTPLALFAIHRSLRLGRWTWFVFTGGVLGAAMLSFQIQSAYYLLLAGGIWFVFLLWHFGFWRVTRQWVGRLAGGFGALALAFGLASVNFLPFLGYVPWSPRGGEGRGYEYATSWSVPPEELVGLAVPERIGILTEYWGRNPFKLHTEYVGALTILLVIAGVYLLRRDRYARFFYALGAFTLTIVLGGYTPLYRLYYALLPGTVRFRAPSIAFFLVVLCLVVVAGLALDRMASVRDAEPGRHPPGRAGSSGTLRVLWRLGLGAVAVTLLWALAVSATGPDTYWLASPGPGTERAALNRGAYLAGIWRFAIFLAVSAAILGAWLRKRLPSAATGLLLASVAVVDLWIIDKRFFDTVPKPSVLFAADEVVDFLRAQEGPFRVFMFFDQPQDNYAMRFGLELIGGEHGNQLHTYNEFLGAGTKTYTDYHNLLGNAVFLALANAKYIVTGQSLGAPFLRPVFQGRTRTGSATVYENTAVLPRAFLSASARRVPEPDGALDEMRRPGFDPRREVLLYADPPRGDSAREPARGEVRIVERAPDRVELRVEAEEPAYLVLTDNYYPDWVAEVDGRATPVLRAYHTFRAVPVAAGEHRVTFEFRPRSLRVGFGLYVTLWALLAACAAALWWRSPRGEVGS